MIVFPFFFFFVACYVCEYSSEHELQLEMLVTIADAKCN